LNSGDVDLDSNGSTSCANGATKVLQAST
jgi:hypothetical protein